MKNWPVIRALLLGGTVAAALDIIFAITFAAYNGMSAERLLQVVASGALGQAAFVGGQHSAALGLLLHFLLSYLWAAIFFVIAWHVPSLTRRPLVSAIGFGIIVFFVMRLVVLPMSAVPFQVTVISFNSAMDLLSHIFLFGLPIAIATGKALALRLPAELR